MNFLQIFIIAFYIGYYGLLLSIVFLIYRFLLSKINKQSFEVFRINNQFLIRVNLVLMAILIISFIGVQLIK